MVCECNKNDNNTTLEFIAGTTFAETINFNDDISDFTTALFTIRANYNSSPVINKSFEIIDNSSVDIALTKEETALFTEFANGKNSASYIWGLDLADDEGNQINVFPQTGKSAPLCVVYKHVFVNTEV